jgi:arylsulfatase A-like enzyme
MRISTTLPLLLAGSLGLVTTAARGQDAAADPRPNIVFMFADDHGAQAIGAYGSILNQTPHIDRLANEGMLFRNCFVTNAICAPSRAVILTGKHSHVNGVTTNAHRFKSTQMSFPKLLREAGYQTALIGKWHLKSTPVGFDHHDVLIGQGPYYNPEMIRNGEKVKRTGYTTELITSIALRWLETQRDPARPFMLMLQHKAPHRNWQPAPGYLDKFDDMTMPEPPTLFDTWEGRTQAAREQKMSIAMDFTAQDLKWIPPHNLTAPQLAAWNAAYDPKNRVMFDQSLEGEELVRWKYQRYVKDYLRCVQSVDDSVGRVLDFLDETGLAASTIVIYSSDQGWFLGEHGWYDKRWMYEESLRTPLLVRWPGHVAAGSRDEHLVQNLDYCPTFLEMAGVDVPNDVQGRSLVPILKGQSPEDWRESIYYQYFEYPGAHSVRRHQRVRTKTHKLIYFYRLGFWELYDLEKDPDEMQSVYDDPAYAEVQAELKAELERLIEHYGVTVEPDLEYDRIVEEQEQQRKQRRG